MKRVLVVIKGLGRGGAEQLLATSARYYDRSRFDYEVAYLLPWKRALAGELENAGVPVTCLGAGSSAADMGWISQLRRLVRERGIDLVHVHSPFVAATARSCLGGERPFVYTEHIEWGSYRRPTYWANLLTYGRNDHVFAVSERVRTSIRSALGRGPLRFLPMPPVETLYHGLDPADVAAWQSSPGDRVALGLPAEGPLVGVVANLRPQKGHRFLLEAAAVVCRRMPEVRFVIVGTGPLEGELRRQALELGVGDRVVFAGFREDAPLLCRHFDLFVLPSLYEGLSIALLEAMALGRPCVVTDVGGVDELVTPERDAAVVPPADPAALAAAVLRVLGDGGLRQRLGEAARRRAASFDIRTSVRRAEDVYESLLGVRDLRGA